MENNIRELIINKISDEFINIRKDVSLTQNEIADILGISKTTVVEVEARRKKFSWPIIISITVLFSYTKPVRDITRDSSVFEMIGNGAFSNNESLKDMMNNEYASYISVKEIGNMAGRIFRRNKKEINHESI